MVLLSERTSFAIPISASSGRKLQMTGFASHRNEVKYFNTLLQKHFK